MLIPLQSDQQAEACLGMGLSKLALGDHLNAYPDIQQALVYQPYFAKAHQAMGLWYQATGNIDSAQMAFSKAIECDSTLYSAYLHYGHSLYEIGHFRDAIPYYEFGVEHLPSDSIAWFELAQAYHYTQNTKSCTQTLARGIEKHPNFSAIYSLKGMLFFANNNFTDALEAFSKALELAPKNAMAYYNYGYTFAKLGAQEQALRALNKAIELEPDGYPEFYDARAHLLEQIGDLPAAIADLDHSIAIFGADKETFAHRARLHMALQHTELACTDWLRAAELGDAEARKMIRKICGND